jgi:diguanylate cyclase (GGDEF)-like protein
MSLRSQILAALSGLFLAVLAVILWVSITSTRAYLEEQLASHAQDTATALSVTLGQSLGRGDLVLAEAQVVSVFDRGYFKTIQVLSSDRSTLLQKNLPVKIEGVPEWFVSTFGIDTPAGEAFVGSGWKQLGKVIVTSQPTYAYQHLWTTSLQQLGWLAALYVAALVLAHAVLQLILKPLYAIEKTAIDVQNKRFAPIALTPRAPELSRVVLAMNQMSRKVGEMLDAETAKAILLHKQAYEDELTGLVNRRGYELRLNELLQGEHQFSLGAVIAVEIDDMRLLSRAQGFVATERILKVVSNSAKSLLATLPVTILARNNEYNYSFIVVDQTAAQVAELATNLRTQVMSQLADDQAATMVGINLGVAFFHQQDKRSDVFARADLAVESARQQDRNGFVILENKPDENSTLGSFGWRTLIQTALVENRWRLLRQPVLSLAVPQTVLQGECMARLVDQQGELVPASNFMPMAARHRLMPEVDKAMVTLALQHLKSHPQQSAEQGLVAINLSPQSMGDRDFMDWFSATLAAMHTGANTLAIEVSEFGALRNVAATLRVRDLVRSFGGKFGIDHFGLDPQALQLLRDVLPDYVKLSGALMDEVERVESVSNMLQSFVTLAHSLDVLVVAQQVERQEQITALSAAKVDAAQGYFFGPPQ